MTDTTTIEIREDQRDALSDLKQFDRETYKEVLDRLLEGDTNETEGCVELANAEQLDEIQRKVNQINRAQGDTVNKALEIGEQGVHEIQEQLDRIESGVKEATNAAQSADRKIEEMGR